MDSVYLAIPWLQLRQITGKNDGKIQGHFRAFGFTVAMAIWGACTNILNWIFSVWEASVQRAWWLTFWHQLLSCDTAIITSGKTKSLRDVLLLHQQKKTVQLYLLPSLILLFLSVHMEGPQEAHGGSVAALYKRPEWRWEECKEIPSAQLRLLGWRGDRGWPILLKHLWSTEVFSFAEQRMKCFCLFSEPQSWSLVKLSVIQTWTTAYHC